ncbi:LacI family transcriptional regulator [Cnuibacter physcomitrellae]|uniref:LacI family transcriptional regulator n=1 Tax=Cnuibacter physcomitrellae TaxID=1619308 RepID=A0A1X9LMA2_9MICO|nr:LacI family DNA-binding transcriptional regulator [Cnuibacter physcomitrellae]ARJ04239.1 LacI family transcriptional regulator [Cnuibacter physcomitrellae]GGI40580.1 LacI family transcriptional regulator [Cnuibacter physcomitrellae]
MTPQQPTLEMVAAEAGVSRSTVSRVVNGSPKVTPEAVAAVEAAIARLDYVPNRVARSLARSRTDVIALLVPEPSSTVFADPFFASIVRGVSTALSETDYTLSLLIASEQQAAKTRRFLLGGNVDGALVVSHHAGDDSYLHLGSTVPLVFGGRPVHPSAADAHYVDVDNVAAARLATAHLLSLGRRRIATIAGRQDMPAGLDRLAGWRAAGGDPALVEVGDFSLESGAAAMERLLERAGDEGIDGVFAANDQMAAGALGVLHAHGLRVPDDVALVGFDDDPYATTTTPQLTTVHQPSAALGEMLATTLVSLIDGDDVPRAQYAPTSLIRRASA